MRENEINRGDERDYSRLALTEEENRRKLKPKRSLPGNERNPSAGDEQFHRAVREQPFSRNGGFSVNADEQPEVSAHPIMGQFCACA